MKNEKDLLFTLYFCTCEISQRLTKNSKIIFEGVFFKIKSMCHPNPELKAKMSRISKYVKKGRFSNFRGWGVRGGWIPPKKLLSFKDTSKGVL